jgi:hypothetical protein
LHIATLGIKDTERRQTQQKHNTENLKDEEHGFQQNDWGELIYFSILRSSAHAVTRVIIIPPSRSIIMTRLLTNIVKL